MHDVVSGNQFQSMLAGLETRLDIVREQFEMEAEFTTGWSG